MEIEINLECEECGEELDVTQCVNASIASVSPCKKCLEKAYEQGLRDGKAKVIVDNGGLALAQVAETIIRKAEEL